jgi:hypothetical protein
MDAPHGRSSNPRARIVDLLGYRRVREQACLPLFESGPEAPALQSSVTTGPASLSERQVAHRARMLAHLTAHR